MPSHDPAVRSLQARAAAHARHAQSADPVADTAPARKAFLERFEAETRAEHPDWTDQQVIRAAGHKRKSYFASLALKSAKARKLRARADAIDAELEDLGAAS